MGPLSLILGEPTMRAEGLGLIIAFAFAAVCQQPSDFPSPPAAFRARAAGWPDFRITSDLVTIPVQVTDSRGRTVLGLGKDDFILRDEGQPEPIVAVWRTDAPISLGIIFDSSGSMRGAGREAGMAVRALLEGANAEDRAFLITFAGRPHVEVPFTNRFAEIVNRLLWSQSAGSTALFDALFDGLRMMGQVRGTQKAMVIFTDGGDNHSARSFDELLASSRERDVQVYSVVIRGNPRDLDEQRGRMQLDRLAVDTGGRSFVIPDASQIYGATQRINELMRNEYLLQYRPPAGLPGKWRRVRVELVRDLKPRRLRVVARSGYFVPD